VTVNAADLARRIDRLIGVEGHPEYAAAMNGLQVDHRGPVHRVAAAVDASQRAIRAAADEGANFLIVHHGLFWGGAQPITGAAYSRLRLLFESDIAVYSAHLPLDSHPEFGNNVLLARQLGLVPSTPFARLNWRGRRIGCAHGLAACSRRRVCAAAWGKRARQRDSRRSPHAALGDLYRRRRIKRNAARGGGDQH